MSDFQSFIDKERDRLTKKKAELEAQVKDLTDAIAGIDREMFAITAYENAKKGKLQSAGSKAPRGTKRDTVLAIISEQKGVTRGDIIDRLGIKGNKGQEQGLSNMLATLKKAGKITATDGKYAIGG